MQFQPSIAVADSHLSIFYCMHGAYMLHQQEDLYHCRVFEIAKAFLLHKMEVAGYQRAKMPFHCFRVIECSVFSNNKNRKLCIELDLKKFVMQRYQDHGVFVIVMEREMKGMGEEEQGGDEL